MDSSSAATPSSGLCKSTRKAPNPRFPYRCCLDEGHTGQHEATGMGGVVVKRWANPEKQDMRDARR